MLRLPDLFAAPPPLRGPLWLPPARHAPRAVWALSQHAATRCAWCGCGSFYRDEGALVCLHCARPRRGVRRES